MQDTKVYPQILQHVSDLKISITQSIRGYPVNYSYLGNPMSKTVGIIGAGVSGLVAVKTCLEEGLQPTAYERSSTIGGIWNYDEDTSPLSPGRMYKSLVSNVCKITLCYSDFPMSQNVPPYPNHEQYIQYLHDYTDHFKLREHIQFKTEVIKIEKADDYDVTGRWIIHSRQDGEEPVKETFDFIMICSGYFTNPVIPSYPGMDEFTGKVLHTASYRRREHFTDKKVLVLGESISSCDIATDISFAAKQVYLSLRNGFWLFKKRGLGGYPYDCYLLNRFSVSFAPLWLLQYVFGGYFQIDANHDALGIGPKRPIFTTPFGINDFLVGQLMNGRVKPMPAVRTFSPKGVELVDGAKLEDLDIVVFGTGYTVTTPFIDDNLVPDDLDTRDLYKYTFPVRLPHATLACIGLLVCDSNVSTVVEMQSRWSVQVFKGLIKLPPRIKMEEDITWKLKELTFIYGKLRHMVRGINLSDELAMELGCYPSVRKLLLTDPRLALKLIFAPASPSSYRLIGPHRWSGARKAVMNSWEDSLSGLSGKVVKRSNSYLQSLLLLALFLIILAIVY